MYRGNIKNDNFEVRKLPCCLTQCSFALSPRTPHEVFSQLTRACKNGRNHFTFFALAFAFAFPFN